VYLMSMQTGEQLRKFTGFVGAPARVDFHPNGGLFAIALGAPDNAVLMFNVETGEVVRRFIGHTAGVNDVVFSPDGRTLLSASDDGTVILWDATTGQPIRSFSGHNNPVQRVAFSPDGRLAISADGQEITVWRIETLQELIEWTLANRAIQPFTCVQRDQYNVRPLCEEMTPTPTPSVSETPTSVPTSFLRGEVIASGAANVRKEPSPDAFVIGTLPRGTIVDILEIEPEWFKILLPDGQEGWISRSLMNRE
jgi:WD40 repeat protein